MREDPKEKSGKYIPKREELKIKRYLQKKYDDEALKLINQEKANLEKFILHSKMPTETIRKLYSGQLQEVKEKIIPIDVSDDDFAMEWLSIPFERKEIDKEKYTSKTDNGELVRSKSEANIANALSKYGVPYKYECPLLLSNGQVIYPDFTVLNKRKRKVIYWEHRGMMDDREYAKHSVQRSRQYTKEGFFLGDNIIITEETLSSPLGTEEIQRVIRHYFL